jgi:hypothetical protein
MKRILLTSTALVAFAGAAAADISFSGSAEFSYSSNAGAFTDEIILTASGSQALDNGYTASTSIEFDASTGVGTVTGGNVALSSDMASITYHIAGDGVVADNLGDHLAQQSALGSVFEEADVAGVTEEAKITASAEMGGVTVRASLEDASGDYALGVATDLSGASVNFGYDGGTQDFGLVVTGAGGDVDFTAAFGSGANDSYGIAASTTVGGADVSLDFGDAGWEVGASMPMGGATVGFTYDDADLLTVTASTSLDAVDLGLEVTSNNTWELTAGVSQGALGANLMVNDANDVELTGSYDIGGGLMAYVGYAEGASNVTYVGAEYDLGNGASLVVSNADTNDAAANEFGQEYGIGTTVTVGFSF